MICNMYFNTQKFFKVSVLTCEKQSLLVIKAFTLYIFKASTNSDLGLFGNKYGYVR